MIAIRKVLVATDFSAPSETALNYARAMARSFGAQLHVMHVFEPLWITSADVVHAVWIPQLNGQIDANPGQVNTLTITNPAPGEYVGHCAEFCGLNHTTMTLDVIVQPPDQLAAWLSDLRAEAAR